MRKNIINELEMGLQSMDNHSENRCGQKRREKGGDPGKNLDRRNVRNPQRLSFQKISFGRKQRWKPTEGCQQGGVQKAYTETQLQRGILQRTYTRLLACGHVRIQSLTRIPPGPGFKKMSCLKEGRSMTVKRDYDTPWAVGLSNNCSKCINMSTLAPDTGHCGRHCIPKSHPGKLFIFGYPGTPSKLAWSSS